MVKKALNTKAYPHRKTIISTRINPQRQPVNTLTTHRTKHETSTDVQTIDLPEGPPVPTPPQKLEDTGP